MYLDNSSLARDFKDLSLSDGSVAEAYIDDFGKLGEFDIVEDDQWPIYLHHGSVVDPGRDVVVTGCCIGIQIKGLHGHQDIS